MRKGALYDVLYMKLNFSLPLLADIRSAAKPGETFQLKRMNVIP